MGAEWGRPRVPCSPPTLMPLEAPSPGRAPDRPGRLHLGPHLAAKGSSQGTSDAFAKLLHRPPSAELHLFSKPDA